MCDCCLHLFCSSSSLFRFSFAYKCDVCAETKKTKYIFEMCTKSQLHASMPLTRWVYFYFLLILSFGLFNPDHRMNCVCQKKIWFQLRTFRQQSTIGPGKINWAQRNVKGNVENERFPSLVTKIEWFRMKITSASDGNAKFCVRWVLCNQVMAMFRWKPTNERSNHN